MRPAIRIALPSGFPLACYPPHDRRAEHGSAVALERLPGRRPSRRHRGLRRLGSPDRAAARRPSTGSRCTRRTCSRRTRTPTTSPTTSSSRTVRPARPGGAGRGASTGPSTSATGRSSRPATSASRRCARPGTRAGCSRSSSTRRPSSRATRSSRARSAGRRTGSTTSAARSWTSSWGSPHELAVFPGHSEETTIGREWDENPFVRVWRGVEPEGDGARAVAAAEATLVVWAHDYDGGGKAWVRFRDGRDAIVGGSRVRCKRAMRLRWPDRVPRRSSSTPRRARRRPTELRRRLAEETRADAARAADADGPRRGPPARVSRLRAPAAAGARARHLQRLLVAPRWRRCCRREATSTPARWTRRTPRSRAATTRRRASPTASRSTSARRSRRSSGSRATTT